MNDKKTLYEIPITTVEKSYCSAIITVVANSMEEAKAYVLRKGACTNWEASHWETYDSEILEVDIDEARLKEWENNPNS
tara:strand:- start:197 stop:433 length:237 start_codon:yes stop_codon:yes gene_type:complete